MLDDQLLREFVDLVKVAGRGTLHPAQAATAEKLEQEILRRMAYKVEPHEVSLRVYHMRHAERRIGEISLSIAGLDKRIAKEYDDLVHEIRRLEHEMTKILEGGKR